MPDNKEQDITKGLNVVFKWAKDNREKESEEWEKGLRDYKGEQMNMKRQRRGKKTNTVTNFLFAQIETIKPILTANIPKVRLRPVRESEAWNDMAKIFTKALGLVFSRNDIGMRVLELVDNGLFFGKGYFKITFDPELLGGFGDIRIQVPSTKTIYLEPEIPTIRDANYIFEARKVNMLSMVRRHPDKMEEVRKLFAKGTDIKQMPGITNASRESFEGKQILPSAPGAASNTTTTTIFDIMEGMNDKERQEGIDLIEAWFHDPELMEVMVDSLKVDGRTGSRKEKRSVPKFPNGRVVQFSGGVLFDDRRNRFPGLPYVEYYNYVAPGVPYGTSELKNTRPIQQQINTRKNQLSDLLNVNLAPTRVIGIGADLKTPWTNEPGQIIRVNDVNQVKVIPPPNVSLAAFNSINDLAKDLETVFGVREVTQGTIPGDIRSGAAIEALQEAADVRLRGKTRQIEVAVKNLSRFCLNMMVAFYEDGTHYYADDKLKKTPEWKETVGKKVRNFADFFDIEVLAGVNLPRSRIAKQQLLLELHNRGIISDQYLASHVDLDDFESLESQMQDIWESRRVKQLAETEGEQVGSINAV